jgi:hypothetical protein
MGDEKGQYQTGPFCATQWTMKIRRINGMRKVEAISSAPPRASSSGSSSYAALAARVRRAFEARRAQGKLSQ